MICVRPIRADLTVVFASHDKRMYQWWVTWQIGQNKAGGGHCKGVVFSYVCFLLNNIKKKQKEKKGAVT